MKDITAVRNGRELDFSEVRKALAAAVLDNREWAGRITYVGGVLKVVELVPSPHAVGEGPLSRQAGAMVPAEVMKGLENKPGLLLFHTHPGTNAGSVPSGQDLASCMSLAYTNRYAAELVVSAYGVYYYTPLSRVLEATWAGEDADDLANVRVLKRVADIHGAFDGARSWEPWTLDDYARMARLYGLGYFPYPNDNLARKYENLFEMDPDVDHDGHLEVIELIKAAEAKAGKKK